MSKISMALRKASVQHQQHNVNDTQTYKPVGGLLSQENRKPTLNTLLLLSVIAFALTLAGGVGAFYHARTKYIENHVESKNDQNHVVRQQVEVVASSHEYPKIYQNIKLNSLENERKLLTRSNLSINHKPKSLSFYTIQVGAFLNPDYAQERMQRLKKDGHYSVEIEKHPSAKGIWRRVHVGKFDAKSEAESYLSKIEKEYNGSYIVKVKH